MPPPNKPGSCTPRSLPLLPRETFRGEPGFGENKGAPQQTARGPPQAPMPGPPAGGRGQSRRGGGGTSWDPGPWLAAARSCVISFSTDPHAQRCKAHPEHGRARHGSPDEVGSNPSPRPWLRGRPPRLCPASWVIRPSSEETPARPGPAACLMPAPSWCWGAFSPGPPQPHGCAQPTEHTWDPFRCV